MSDKTIDPRDSLDHADRREFEEWDTVLDAAREADAAEDAAELRAQQEVAEVVAAAEEDSMDTERQLAIRLAENDLAGFERALPGAVEQLDKAMASYQFVRRNISKTQLKLAHLRDGGSLDDLAQFEASDG